MRMTFGIALVGSASMPLVGCASTAKRDLAHDPFPEAQAELREVVEKILRDSESADVEGLRDVHLNTAKFTKFGGGSAYERMNYTETIATETAAITSVQDRKDEARDLKIDVFGEVAVVTYYPYRIMYVNDEPTRISTRQTLVFLKTPDGWKIVHEHQSPKRYDLANYPFPEAQAKLRAVLHGIYDDAKKANLDGLRASRVKSDKFTKFGPRLFGRQNVLQCNETEAAFVTSIEDADFELKDLKIDVFGEVAVATYYKDASFKSEGETVARSVRQTLVFLATPDGWKIIHEHGTPKACFE